jgi:hypothetical protein
MKFVAFYDYDDVQIQWDSAARSVRLSLDQLHVNTHIGDQELLDLGESRTYDLVLRAAKNLIHLVNKHEDGKEDLYDFVKKAIYAPLEQLPSFLQYNNITSVIASVRLSEAGREPRDLEYAEFAVQTSKQRLLQRVKEVLGYGKD